jgi:UDP:flavonoid glycosyltransferase YjiC (YdhE family)
MRNVNIAYYVTPHGLGHATRALEVMRELMRRGHSVVLSSGAAGMYAIAVLLTK